MERRVVFTGKGEVAVEDYDPGRPGPGEARVRTLVSLMSTGTEGIVLHRRFAPGTHWDGWVKYPFYPGYSAVSEVEEVGPGVSDLKPGDRVASRTAHASAAVLPVSRLFPIPADLAPEDASWFGLAKIALVGARAAGYRLGGSALVVGAGPIGQMTVRWAAAAGVSRLVALDPVAMRGEFARRGGADTVLTVPADGAKEAVRDAFGGALPEVVVDTTGHPEVFAAATRLVADRGTLVLLGDAGSPAEQRLTSDVITRGLRIVGCHDKHLPEETASYDPFLWLARTGRFPVEGLITHTFAGNEAPAAYALATDRRQETLGILLDWRS